MLPWLTPDSDPVAALIQMIARLEATFGGELRLMVDYIGRRSGDEVTQDPALRLYRIRLDAVLETIVGWQRVPQARILIYGILLDRLLAGQSSPLDGFRPILEAEFRKPPNAE